MPSKWPDRTSTIWSFFISQETCPNRANDFDTSSFALGKLPYETDRTMSEAHNEAKPLFL